MASLARGASSRGDLGEGWGVKGGRGEGARDREAAVDAREGGGERDGGRRRHFSEKCARRVMGDDARGKREKKEKKGKKEKKEKKEKRKAREASAEVGARDGKRVKSDAGEPAAAAAAAERPTFDSFEATPFDAAVVARLKSAFPSPSPIQSAAWPAACSGKDVVAVAKTGSGKTLAFLLPMFHGMKRRGDVEGLVVAPTRELAIQIQAECEKFGAEHGFQSVVVYGGASAHEQKHALRTKKPCIVIGTPGRLTDLMSQEGMLSLEKLSVIVLDEADRMLDMGFEPQIKTIFAATPTRRQTLLFSATWPKSVRKLAAGYLNQDKSRVQEIFIGEGAADGELAANKAISQRFIQARDHEKDEHLYNLICEFPDDSRVVIFANTKRRVENLAKTFAAEGFGTVSVHGDKSQADREASLRKFIENRAPLMMATDVAARGLDIKGVSHVVNYDMARDVESYVHRIGRTGRAGELGAAVTFWNVDYDKPCAPALCKIARDAGQAVPDWLTKFEKTKESKQWRVADAHM